MDIRELGWGDMDSINLAQDSDKRRALVNKLMDFRASIKYSEILE
jgi:hypothetical protein